MISSKAARICRTMNFLLLGSVLTFSLSSQARSVNRFVFKAFGSSTDSDVIPTYLICSNKESMAPPPGTARIIRFSTQMNERLMADVSITSLTLALGNTDESQLAGLLDQVSADSEPDLSSSAGGAEYVLSLRNQQTIFILAFRNPQTTNFADPKARKLGLAVETLSGTATSSSLVKNLGSLGNGPTRH